MTTPARIELVAALGVPVVDPLLNLVWSHARLDLALDPLVERNISRFHGVEALFHGGVFGELESEDTFTVVGDDRYEDGWSGFQTFWFPPKTVWFVVRKPCNKALAPSEGSHQKVLV